MALRDGSPGKPYKSLLTHLLLLVSILVLPLCSSPTTKILIFPTPARELEVTEIQIGFHNKIFIVHGLHSTEWDEPQWWQWRINFFPAFLFRLPKCKLHLKLAPSHGHKMPTYDSLECSFFFSSSIFIIYFCATNYIKPSSFKQH